MPREFVEVEWDETVDRITRKLPPTQPTGRALVKRKGQPVAVRKEAVSADDVLEWQIAYQGEEGDLVELGKALQLASQHGLLTTDDLKQLRAFLEQQTEFCDEKFAVLDEPTLEEFSGFKIWWRKHPVLRQDVGIEATIEIELRHRQKAVGFQAMVFLLVLIRLCETSVIGRTAKPKEVVKWSLSAEVLKELVRAFTVASRRHRDDMAKLLWGV